MTSARTVVQTKKGGEGTDGMVNGVVERAFGDPERVEPRMSWPDPAASAGDRMAPLQSRPEVDETDIARSHLYALLAGLLLRAPDAATLAQLSAVQGTATPIGLAQIALAEAAAAASVADAQQEYFDLFIGVGRGELLPYASYYLTGFLNERPLARLRGDLRRLGLERAEGHREPEDHLGTLCEIMSGFACGAFEASQDEERQFFLDHIAPWAPRFFADLEMAKRAKLYAPVGRIGGLFMDIETEAFALDA